MIYFRGDNKSSLPRRVFLVVVMQLVQLMYNIQFNVSLHSGFWAIVKKPEYFTNDWNGCYIYYCLLCLDAYQTQSTWWPINLMAHQPDRSKSNFVTIDIRARSKTFSFLVLHIMSFFLPEICLLTVNWADLMKKKCSARNQFFSTNKCQATLSEEQSVSPTTGLPSLGSRNYIAVWVLWQLGKVTSYDTCTSEHESTQSGQPVSTKACKFSPLLPSSQLPRPRTCGKDSSASSFKFPDRPRVRQGQRVSFFPDRPIVNV